jgi:predicted PurR-regulated permease PerM
MRIEYEFQPEDLKRSLHRWLVILLPFGLAAVALWLWWQPVVATLSPFAIAFVLAYVLNPVVERIAGVQRNRFRIHRGLAILLLFLSAALVVVAAVAILVPALVRESSQFITKVNRNYGPALRERLRPKVEEWFSPQSLALNGDFHEWEGGTPASWQIPRGVTVSYEAAADSRLVLMETSESGGAEQWILAQPISGLVSEETYTLAVEVASCTPANLSTEVRLVPTEALEAGRILDETAYFQTKLPTAGNLRARITLPPGAESTALVFIWGESQEPRSLALSAVRYSKPPPFPFFTYDFWAAWAEKNRDLFTLQGASGFFAFGAKGAGLVVGGAGGIWSWLSDRVGGLFSFFVFFGLLLVVLFYMLLDFDDFLRSLSSLAPEATRPRLVRIARELDLQIGGFLRGQVKVCFCMGVMVSIAMLLLGVPFALPIGIAAGLFNFIPYLGPAMGIIPAVSLTLLDFFDPGLSANWVTMKLALLLGAFVVIQMIDGFFISPSIIGQTVDVPPLVVLGALLLGGAIGGVTGMILAIPIYCTLRVFVGEYRRELQQVHAAQSSGSG